MSGRSAAIPAAGKLYSSKAGITHPMHRGHSFQPVDAALLGAVLIWGSNLIVVKSTLLEIPPLAFNAVRFVIAPALLLFLTWLIEHDIAIARKDWGLALLVGLLGHFAHQVLFVQAMARTTATNVALILAATPAFVALIGVASRRDRLTARNWSGILLSFVGIFLVISAQGPGLQFGRQTLSGDLMMLGSTVLWALYLVLSKPLVMRTSALRAAAWSMLVAAPLLVLAGVPQLRSHDWRTVSPGSWLGLLYSAVFSIGISYAIWNLGIRHVGSARVAVYSYLTPLVTVIIAWVALGEVLQPLQAVGGVMVLVGVALGRHSADQI